MFFTAIIPNGRYIKKRLSLCHKPSFAITVFENSSLSDMMNSVKNRSERTKHATLIQPVSPSLLLNDSMAVSKGTKRKSIKPTAEPAPCIFEAVVTSSLDSFTLKKHVKIHAPTENAAMKMIAVMVNPFETGAYIL